MKRLTATSIVALGAIFAVAPASASDIYSDANPGGYAKPYTAPVNWTGLFVGGRFGWGNSNHNLSLEEYLKDFCFDGDPAQLNAFDDSNHGRPAREWTLAAKNDFFDVAGTSCETLDIDGEGSTFGAGDYVTIPGDSRELASIDGLGGSGLVGGGQIGFDKQIGRFVVGVFGSYDFADIDGSASFGPDEENFSFEKGDEWSAGVRAGYLLAPRALVYGLVAYTEAEHSFSGFDTINPEFDDDKDVTFSGVTVGGGLEYAVTNNVFLGVEGTHTFYGEETIVDAYSAEANQGARITSDLDETKVMGTLKIKLNSDVFGR